VAALATSADVEAQLGRSLTSDEEERVDALLNAASVRARSRTGRQFTAGDYTVERSVDFRGRVRLPETVDSVSEVRAVYNDGTTEVIDEDAWTLRGNTIYNLTYWCRVEVDYTVSADIPDDIIAAVAAIAASGLSMSADGVQSETIGGFTIRYRDGSTALTTEAEVFRLYAAPSLGPIDLLG
jgi:hypothetical protein